MVVRCPSTNTAAVEEDHFLSKLKGGGGLEPHEIGWLVSGAAAAVTLIISFFNIFSHASHYTRPLEQRQIIRILLFAPIYAVVSFLAYRFYREFEYFEIAETAMEAIAISAFLMLLLQYIGHQIEDQKAVFGSKDKTKLPIPFCCWRYRPSKAYFLFLLKWAVLQYVIVRPALSIAGIILQYYDLLCTQTYSYKYGEVYIAAIDFVSISIALYGLIVLYDLLKEDLYGRKPLSKFLTIKLAIFFTFYQSFVFGVLQDHGVLKPTTYWTSTNIANGLNALCTSLEMVIVAFWQLFAFPASEYKLKNLGKPLPVKEKKHKKSSSKKGKGDVEAQDVELNEKLNNQTNLTRPQPTQSASYQHQSATMRLRGESHVIQGTSVGKTNPRGRTNVFRSLIHALNISDFAIELWHSFRFGFDRIRGKEYTREDMRFGKGKFDFDVMQNEEPLLSGSHHQQGSPVSHSAQATATEEGLGSGPDANVMKEANLYSADGTESTPREATAAAATTTKDEI
ncbi:hypothetical protein OC846_005938 [Tilletia horrida]|uniref:DUF300-domain-containing protein n=1 Tax=Tilletia horrida TaxID=155126 RepID=A0AAN6GMK1_9BASI|nr:hypothetical protein OC846_005938 [Tilletia horrida]KAK0560922.1 hypothetical protein OC861_006066 [Tilletia horrida]